ncbi:hypothetical protein GW17_00031284 [Ensete ventricosum]|nr:hypothetical protein GW17_00031284 [Ensete ventricosum]
MLRLGVTQEWVDEGELARERTKNQRWQRLYEVLAEATHGEVVVRRQVFGVYASKLASDESLGHQHMGAMYHRGRSQIASTSESHGGDLIIQRYYQSGWRVGLLQYSHSLKGARQVKGQGRPSNLAFSTTKRMGKVECPSSLTYPAEELCISSELAEGDRELARKAKKALKVAEKLAGKAFMRFPTIVPLVGSSGTTQAGSGTTQAGSGTIQVEVVLS